MSWAVLNVLLTAKESQLHTTKGGGKYKQEKRTKTLPTSNSNLVQRVPDKPGYCEDARRRRKNKSCNFFL